MKKYFYLVFALVILFLWSNSFAGEESGNQEAKKEQLSEWSKQWLEEVVPYIITKAEKELFLSLPNEEERGKFIEKFWEKRDPNPLTPENEFKIAYYKRIAFANKFFATSGLPGWKTDRGKIFILLGPPGEIQHDFTPSSSFLTVTASREIWNYWDLTNPKLPYNLEFVFVDKYGTDNFVLENSLILNDQRATNLDVQSIQYHFDRMEIAAEAMKNPFEKMEELREIITTQVTYDLIPFDYDIFSLKGTEKKPQATLIIDIPYAGLASKLIEENSYYSLTLMVSVSNEIGQNIFLKNRDLNFHHPISKAAQAKNWIYQARMPMTIEPGNYGIHLLILDNFSGKIGTSHRKATIPDFSAENLALSDIFLTGPGATKEQANEMSFLPGQTGIPASGLKKLFRSGEEMTVTFEVYNISLQPETRQGSIFINYSFFKNGENLTSVPLSRKSLSDENDCRVRTSLLLKNFQPGSYKLRIEVRDEKSQASCSKEVFFQVVQ